MKNILLFAGTTEGRKLSETLAAAQISHTVCVATEYGEIVLTPHPMAKVHSGRMDREEMGRFMKNGAFDVVVDATHPFAREATCNIKDAVRERSLQGREILYLRLKRDSGRPGEGGDACFHTNAACAKALENTRGNILLTTGSKELSEYCKSEQVKKRLFVRVLPGVESILACREQGICGKQILAMQGPFTVEMNEAIIRQYGISYLVTKESGTSGGYEEKLEAAARTGVQVFVIGLPKGEEGVSFVEICGKLEEICQKTILPKGGMEIILAGIGMGQEECLTGEVKRAVGEADILLGAQRMLERFPRKSQNRPFYQAKQVIPYLREIQEKNVFLETRKVVILFSGDSGFYSGCQDLYRALEQEIGTGRLKAVLRVMPGISSVAYLASRIGIGYQDAAVYSMHGKKVHNLVRKIQNSPQTFFLTSGAADVRQLGERLLEAGMAECEIIVGYQLSYGNERIGRHTPAECAMIQPEGLYTCLVRNPYATEKKLTHGMEDGAFIRERIPMTKEEVREISICKLRLTQGAVVYDIGSGTGSMAVEMAGLSDSIQVYAIEGRAEAVSLMEKNRAKFALENMEIREAWAPEGLDGLPAATHAFIGGSNGRLKEILDILRQKNPRMRVVVTAVSMETICGIKDILTRYGIQDPDIVQVQVSRARAVGTHHLMQAQNPVWIFAFSFA